MSAESKLVTIGASINDCKTLLGKLIEEFKSNEVYRKCEANQIETTADLTQLNIKTKYYDLNLSLELKEFESVEPKREIVDGFIILLNDAKNLNLVRKILGENEESFKALVVREKKLSEQVNELLDEFDDLVKIESFDDDEKNESVCDLIDSLFVHQWPRMKLKQPVKSAPVEEAAPKDGQMFEDDFESMLMNLQGMREKAEQMSFEERKKFAEDVALKFWKTIGGDDEEINDDF